jgi:predicted ATP-dependent endonuclease of OLD family
VTTLVGRNESGKTNLLLALHSINPPGGPQDLSAIKDFPRHRRMSECTPETRVVDTIWEFETSERSRLVALFPRAKDVTEVSVERAYKAGSRWVVLRGLPPVQFEHPEILAKFRKLKAALVVAGGKLETGPKSQLEAAIATAEPIISQNAVPDDWAVAAKPAITSLRQVISSTGTVSALTEAEAALANDIESLADTITADEKAHLEARKWAMTRVPVFVYVDEYPELDGHQNIDQYLQRKASNQRTTADLNFEKLCKVADLNPQQLRDLLASNDHETRNQLANRAGAVVTGEMRRLWRDRALKVRFNPDAAHLDTLISDPNALYDVEVNLDERSRGFKWFFSFYVSFAADTKGGSAENAILLLDEPGLYLHASSQADLLKHLATDFKNQVIYTTHSPFMVPSENLDWVRTVNIDQEEGTTATNDPSGDPRTLFPIQAALGYYLAQAMFVGPDNLIVEGVTDYWIISSVSAHIRNIGHL